MNIKTIVRSARTFFTTSAARAAYAAIVESLNPPAQGATGFIVIGESGMAAGNFVKVSFWGAGAEDSQFNARVIGWYRRSNRGGGSSYKKVVLADVTCTLGAQLGLGAAGNPPLTTERIVDTITLNAGDPSARVIPGSGTAAANGSAAMLVMDPMGAEFLEMQPGNTGAATSVNGDAGEF